MVPSRHHLILLGSVVAIGFASGQESKAQPAKKRDTAEGVAFFEKKIRPVLVAECYQCHSAEKGKKVRGGLSLDTREGTRKGGDSGPAIVPGKPEQSLLIKAMSHADSKTAMPPKKKLGAEIVQDFQEWIRIGAPDPRDGASTSWKYIDIEEGRKHWSYQPPVKSVPPGRQRYFLATNTGRSVRPGGTGSQEVDPSG